MFNDFYHGKKVLVTGHTGFKGSWLSLWLLSLGADVAGFSAYIPSHPANFEVLNLPERMRHYTGDIRDLATLTAVCDEFRPELVFHLAAQPIVTVSYDDPKLTFDTNVGGTVNVLEAVLHIPSIRGAVMITSDKCYENVEWEYGYRETDRLGGKDPYSASKAAAENVISAYGRSYFRHDSGKRVVSVRAGNVIGGGDWAKDRIVPDCVRAWAENRSPEIRSPHATRPWQHVLEPLSGYLHVGAQLLSEQGADLNGEAFNFGPSEKVNESVGQLIGAMTGIWSGKTWQDVSNGHVGKKEAGLLKLNCDKARHRLDWNATLSLEETIRMTVEWYMQYYQGQPDMMGYTQDQIRAYQALASERGQKWTGTQALSQPLKV